MIEQETELKAEGTQLQAAILYSDSNIREDITRNFFKNVILVNLADSSNVRNFKSALFSFSEFLQHFPKIIEADSENILNYLIQRFDDPTTDKDLYINIFRTISDIFCAFPRMSVKYLERVFRYVLLAMDVVKNFTITKRKNMLTFCENLKLGLLEFFQCNVHYLYYDNIGPEEQFVSMYLKVQEFIKVLSTPDMNPTYNFIKESIHNILDFWIKKKENKYIDMELVRYFK